MGKQGPCHHCGVTSTPLWRNGPPEKPILCNACGSRWRTKGSLVNYTPLHARELIDSEEFQMSKVKSTSFKPKEKKLHKIKQRSDIFEVKREMPYSDQNFRKFLEGDTSNRSSSGSAISYSESCAHFGTTDASDLTGSAQSNVWVPSKKRSSKSSLEHRSQKSSPLEKLTKDLYTIFREQQSSNLSGSSEEDLLYESETPMGSFEIGNGSVLIRYPNPKIVEEESEASSLPLDNKSYILNEAYSVSASFPVHNESKQTSLSNAGIEKLKKSTAQVAQEDAKRDKHSADKLHILRDKDSPLRFIDLKDVVNFEVLVANMAHEEQQQLMKYLPPVDAGQLPESLKTMFHSNQFVESLSYYQQLLQEGVFDMSVSGVNVEDCKALKMLVSLNLKKCTWVERYSQLKDVKYKKNTGAKEVARGPNFLKRSRDIQSQHDSELKGTMRSPKRMSKCGGTGTNPSPIISPQPDSSEVGSKSTYDTDEYIDTDGACFSPRTFFASPPDRSSMLGSLQFTDDSSDHDLLLDVPRSASSFPESELLYHPWRQKEGFANNSAAESGIVADGEESLSSFPVTSFRIQHPRHR